MGRVPIHTKPRRITVIKEEIKLETLFRKSSLDAFVHQIDELRAKYAEYSFIYKYDVIIELNPDHRWSGTPDIIVKVVREETSKEFIKRLEKQQLAKEVRELREIKKAEEAVIEATIQANKASLKEMALYEKLKEKYG